MDKKDVGMIQRFSKPDWYCCQCGHLDVAVTRVPIHGAPMFMVGLRAVFVSDIHATRRTTGEDLRNLWRRVIGVRPDILLMGGDYSDTVEGALRVFESLQGVDVPLGIYAAIGNNDAKAWTNRLEELKRAMFRASCEMLVNGAIHLPLKGGVLDIAGVDEHLYGKPDVRGLYPERPQPNRYRILLSHYPRPIQPTPDLMLSGHTHGGQFNLMGITPFNLGFERLTRPNHRNLSPLAISGQHEVGEMKLLVSKGTGASRIQLRVGVRPEINLLEFC